MLLKVGDFGCVPNGRFLRRVTIKADTAVLHEPDGTLRATDVNKRIAIPGGVDLAATITALANRKDVVGASMTAGDQKLSAPGQAFSINLQGLAIRIDGAGAGGATLVSRVSKVVSSISLLLTDAAATTVTNAPTAIDGKTFAGAAMTAGNTTLSALGHGFRADLHKGLRITVDGAGPGGTTLVSDVIDVRPPSSLVLSDAAATTVTNAPAVLNRPDFVAVSDYARAGVDDVAVDLGDRTITDGKMTIGSRGLRSATAKFSSLDIGKKVSVRAAGLLLTTIQSFKNSTEVTLAAAAKRDVQAGPADVWQAESQRDFDSRPGFEKLVSTLATLDVESAEIVFDSGVYDFTRSPIGTKHSAIDLLDLRNLTLRGAGRGATILRLMPDQTLPGDTHVIEMRGCGNLTLRDLSIHGAYLTTALVNEQMHGIQVNAGCEDIVVERVAVFQSAGDGIRFLGDSGGDSSAPRKVRRVWVQNCSFVQNKRSGVSFQRATEFVWINHCYIEMTPPSTDSCIDFEPTGSLAPTDVIIESNFLVHGTQTTAVSISGISGADPTRRVKFINNTVQGGGVEGVDAVEVTVADNTIQAGGDGPVATFRGKYDHLRLESNKIVATGVARPAVVVAQRNGFAPSNLWVENNHIESTGQGIVMEDPGSHVEIRGNRLLGNGEFVGIGVTLKLHTVGVHRDFKITGNTVADFARVGIQLSTFDASERFEGVSIDGNEIYLTAATVPSTAVGISLRSGGGTGRSLERAVVAENRISDNIHAKLDRPRPAVSFIAIAGNPGARALFEGDGSPEGVVAAPFGSLFCRVDTESETALYLKRSGTGNTGWVKIATATP
jgi:hypothetical protein